MDYAENVVETAKLVILKMLQYVYHVSQILSFHMVAAQYVIRRVNLASLLQIQLYVPIVNQDHI